MENRAIPPTSQLQPVSGLPARDPRERRRDLAAGAGLALLAFALYLLPSLWRPLEETAEARVAVVARGMLRSGDWLVPRLGAEVRLNKPPLPYWLVACAERIKDALTPLRQVIYGCCLPGDAAVPPVGVLVAVLPSALLGALCVFLVLIFTARVYGRPAGLWAALILGFSFLFCRFAQLGTGEMPLTFFTTAALLAAAWLSCLPRPGLSCALGLGLSLGLAVLTKWHVPLVVVLSAVFLEVLRRRRFNGRKVLLFLAALLIAAAIVAPWCRLIRQHVPEAQQVMWREVNEAYRVGSHSQDDWAVFYFYQFASALLPWTPLLLLAWPAAAARLRREEKGAPGAGTLPRAISRFLLGAVILNFLIFYVFPKQQYYYLLPLIPPLSIVAGRALARLDRPGGLAEERLAWLLIVLGVLLGAGVGCAFLLIAYLPWAFTVPLGALVLICYFAGARQWAEGHSTAVCLSLGLAALAAGAGWTTFAALHARDHYPLARDSRGIQQYLRSRAVRPKVFSVRLKGISKEELLYYLDWDRILGLRELLQDGVSGVDEKGHAIPRPQPPGALEQERLLISSGKTAAYLARELRYQPSSEELRIFPLPGDNREINWDALLRLRNGRAKP